MRVVDKTNEGYRPIIENKPGLAGRTKEFYQLMTTRDPKKRERLAEFDRIVQDIVQNPTDEKLDVELLSRQPIFDIKGFQSHPPEVYPPGKEPPIAPISKEQMRLLLASIIPAAMIPFVLERFVFEFKPTDPNDSHPGPEVTVKKDEAGRERVHIALTREHFITKGVPPSLVKDYDAEGPNILGPTLAAPLAQKNAQRRTKIAGFVDPSRMGVYMGKIFAEFIPPPPPTTEQEKKRGPLGGWEAMIDKNFYLTKDKKNKRENLRQRRNRSQRRQEKLRKQWKDFIALAITAPDLAMQQSRQAYDYFRGEAEKFNTNPERDDEAIRRLKDLTLDHGGAFQLEDYARIKDLRTEAEKQQDAGISPELAWYEKFITGINSLLAAGQRLPLLGKLPLFGYRLTYELPEDPERAEQLAGDDKEVKKLLEQLDENIRDAEFIQLLKTSTDYDKHDRNAARRYLLASSQAGEFAEWRIYAWLYKYSRTFRGWGGQYISEEDYKDLQMIYSQSEKVGNRLGTGVIPYKARPLTPRSADIQGTRKFIYEFKGPDYMKEVEKKLRNKSLSTLTSASDKAFDQFKKPGGGYFEFNELFDDTPAGMQVQTANLLEAGLPPEMGAFLRQMGVGKVSADAKAMAIAFFDHYKDNNRQSDRYISPKALEIMGRYKNSINVAPEEKVKALFDINAKTLAESADFKAINDKFIAAEEAIELVGKTLGADLSNEPYSNLLLQPVRDQILMIIKAGNLRAPEILQQIEPVLHQVYGDVPENIEVSRKTITRFLYDNRTIKNLILLEKIYKYRKELLPPRALDIKKAADQLIGLKPADAVAKYLPQHLTHPQFEEYLKKGLQLTEDEVNQIRNADQDLAAAIEEEAEKEEGEEAATPAVNTDIREESDAKQRQRALVLASKLADPKTNPLIREQLVADSVKAALTRLQKTFIYVDAGVNLPLAERYRLGWLGAEENKIFQLPALQPTLNEISTAVSQGSSDDPSLQSYGLKRLSDIITTLTKATNYEQEYVKQASQKPKDKPRNEKPAAEEEDEEEAKKAA